VAAVWIMLVARAGAHVGSSHTYTLTLVKSVKCQVAVPYTTDRLVECTGGSLIMRKHLHRRIRF
jgi:hypothetical protein